MHHPFWIAVEAEWPTAISPAILACAKHDELAWLDSVGIDAAAAGSLHDGPVPAFSLIAVAPQRRIGVSLPPAAGAAVAAGEGWERLAAAVRAVSPVGPGDEFPSPLRGAPLPGWIGFVGYEMACGLEHVAIHDADFAGIPAMRFALFARGIILEHAVRRAWVVGCVRHRADEDGVRALAARWNGAVADATRCARLCERDAPGGEQREEPAFSAIEHETSEREHARMVARAHAYVSAGDIYQVNLAHRLRLTAGNTSLSGGAAPVAAMSVYTRLRRRNPAGFAALLSWGDAAIASVSPERFLELRGRSVLTSPIKGTRPRLHEPAADRAAVESLLGSAKDAAELAMIVDLHRNDLGRVCVPGTVRVTDARRIEAHPTVFHTVADIRGELRPGLDAIDLLRACFPAGSVTGVPKIRAMQIIHELERAPRGVYTGAIGVIGLDGNMSLSVAIRTLQASGGEALLHVGGGIVADSRADEEYAETLAKGRGILDALLPKSASRPAPITQRT